MSVYTSRGRRSLVDDLVDIISDQPTTITRTRSTTPDPTRAPVIVSAGPYTARIDAFRATRNATTFDEKGSSATSAYVLVAVNKPSKGWNLPKKIDNEPVFKLNDILTDADGNKYRVTSPGRWSGDALEINVELQG